MQYKTVTINAQNEWTDWVELSSKTKNEQRQFFDVMVSNLQGNTIAVQAKRPGEADGAAVDLANPPDANNPHVVGSVVQSMLVRAGVPTGGFSLAGTVVSVAGGK